MTSPIRRQYLDVKARHPDALVLFRMGDFYETFDDDARTAARDLEIVLTQRDMGGGVKVPLAGIPYHALDSYLARLIKKGHRVAICEQTSEPDGRRLVDREVVRIVTPGTVVEPALLEESANSYLAAAAVNGERAGVAYVDVTTGEFAATETPAAWVGAELARLAPREVLLPADAPPPPSADGESAAYLVSPRPASAFDPETARRLLLEHFGAATLEAFGLDGMPLAAAAAGAAVDYLADTHKAALGLLHSLRVYSTDSFMALDPQTRRNLELFEGGRRGERAHSLLGVLDATKTPMGARLLRRWIGEPLLDAAALEQRLDAVEWLKESAARRGRVERCLAQVGDVERALHRMGAGAAPPREALALRRALEQAPPLREALAEAGDWLAWLWSALDPCAEAVGLIASALADEPQGEPGQGGVIRQGFSRELDELREASTNARAYIAGLEKRERERSGIPSLKVGYNKVFGYYLEVTNPHLARVPDDYVRRQTLANGERFYTPELKEYESRVLNARERMEELEGALYRQLCRQVAEMGERIAATAQAMAAVDALASLAEAAARYGYVRPALDDGGAIDVRGGRHPVVERLLPAGGFVPNDLALSREERQVLVVTGPNMAGKSTYLRQAALIALMAQIGSFVPADSARIGLVDRIFTRVGLQDDLGAGQSTFMVEMVETAAILHQATGRSLVVLDEIGRGTSTYDGLSIAQAVAEHVHNDPRLGCRTLFATHYHELTELAARLPRVHNCSVAVAEQDGEVVFLHRIAPGGADRSYGVHVAQLAGMPRPVLQRAWELLAAHEGERGAGQGAYGRGAAAKPPGLQLDMFAEPPQPSPIVEELLALDLNAVSPIEALNRLYALQAQARANGGGEG